MKVIAGLLPGSVLHGCALLRRMQRAFRLLVQLKQIVMDAWDALCVRISFRPSRGKLFRLVQH
jgi:hypothetical protein